MSVRAFGHSDWSRCDGWCESTTLGVVTAVAKDEVRWWSICFEVAVPDFFLEIASGVLRQIPFAGIEW